MRITYRIKSLSIFGMICLNVIRYKLRMKRDIGFVQSPLFLSTNFDMRLSLFQPKIVRKVNSKSNRQVFGRFSVTQVQAAICSTANHWRSRSIKPLNLKTKYPNRLHLRRPDPRPVLPPNRRIGRHWDWYERIGASPRQFAQKRYCQTVG